MVKIDLEEEMKEGLKDAMTEEVVEKEETIGEVVVASVVAVAEEDKCGEEKKRINFKFLSFKL